MIMNFKIKSTILSPRLLLASRIISQDWPPICFTIVFGIISAVMIIYYLFFGLTCHSMVKIKKLTPHYLRRRSTTYEELDSVIQEEICLASFYMIGAIFCSSWSYLIYSWKVLYLAIKYSIAAPFYILPKYLIHKSFNKKRLSKCNRKERKNIINSYDDLLDD